MIMKVSKFLLFCATLCCTVLLSSCSKDDDGLPSEVSELESILPGYWSRSSGGNPSSVYYEVSFRKNKTFKDGHDDTGKWRVTDDLSIILKYESGYDKTMVFRVDNFSDKEIRYIGSGGYLYLRKSEHNWIDYDED